MKTTSTAASDGTDKVEISFRPGELEMFRQALTDIVAALEKTEGQSAAAKGMVRCCECHDSRHSRHEIEESNDVLAFAKCLEKCGPAFNIRNRPCDES